MRIEEIRESIEVIALFRRGKLEPLKFRWKDRSYRVSRINGDWNTEVGASRFHHFAVMSEGPDIYELSYDERAQSWKIESVSLLG